MSSPIPSFLQAMSGRLLLSLVLLHAVLVGASPMPAVEDDMKGTLPSIDKPLAKRVQGQFPTFLNTFEGRVQKGRYFMSLMPLSDSAATERNRGVKVASPWQDPRWVEYWGWTRQMDWAPFGTEDIGDSSDDNFDQFEVSPGFGNTLDNVFADPRYPVDPMEHALSTYKHEKRFYLRNKEVGDPTNAYYQNVLNPKSGAIIFDKNFSPRYEQAETGLGSIPELEQLSDIIYFQWLQACQKKGVHPSKIKLIYRAHVTYKPTFDIVMEALRQANYQSVPGWNERAIFPMDTIPGMAILGTTHGVGTALFLIQHKAILGTKKIAEVAVWGGDDGFAFDKHHDASTLSLRFTVTD
ncbi:hypothetical protein CDEST_14299 [Colletotrichum destructivum]|uniref:WD domain-containing protein n=1 Tax=Colletotrichum destructivum TaxID=34406 RepID=A0AAX4J1Q2_9PEZI|nr:hypothetical protein CDEST_14299 [Colletotrichum destructivum]